MLMKRHAEERGHTKTDWLDGRHSFSFGNYQDANWTQFRNLRVINEDHVAPQSGFAPHSHKNMEIFTYVVAGQITHKDSTGAEKVLGAGDVQLMSAGRGIQHSEMNNHPSMPCHLLQIWIIPDTFDTEPSYQEARVKAEDMENNLKLILSPEGISGSMKIRQDVYVYTTRLMPGQSIAVSMEKNRHVWAQVVSGSCTINGESADLGDGIALSDEQQITIEAQESPADILLFDMA